MAKDLKMFEEFYESIRDIQDETTLESQKANKLMKKNSNTSYNMKDINIYMNEPNGIKTKINATSDLNKMKLLNIENRLSYF